MQPKRVLVVIDEMEVGGSQCQVVHLLTGLDKSLWQPELVYFRSSSFLLETLEQAGVRVHHIPKRRRIDPSFFNDSSGLAQCMRRLTGEPALRRRLSQQARLQAERSHSIPALVAATVAVYDRCIRSARSRTAAGASQSVSHPLIESDHA